MRNVGAILALICSTSISAQTLKMGNEAGGQIVLTQQECRYGGESFLPLLKAYGYADKGTTINGCWQFRDGLIQVHWFVRKTIETSTYKPEDFTYHPEGK